MSIHLHAPDGYQGLLKGVAYHMLHSSGTKRLLVSFYRSIKSQWRVSFMRVESTWLEERLTSERREVRRISEIVQAPWLESYNPSLHAETRSMRPDQKRTHQEIRQKRLDTIGPLLEKEEAILADVDPLALISRIGRKQIKGTHVYKLQLWFFAYQCFDKDEIALSPETYKNGTWSRAEHADKKFGRPSFDRGASHGWSSLQMADQIRSSYLNRCGSGTSLAEIYRQSIRIDFGCETESEDGGETRIVHRQNQPFPTEDQFRYRINLLIGRNKVATTKNGAARVKQERFTNEGNYSSQYQAVLEHIAVDGYQVKARAKAVLSDAEMPPLIVVRGRCSASGAITGVGFSLGGEKTEAYRSMLFCMAIGDELIERLYGLEIGSLNWGMKGVARSLLSDRGPAGHVKWLEKAASEIVLKEMAPSYDGQAKASIESSHPKSTKLQGAPSYLIYDGTIHQLIKEEVFKAARYNRETSIADRLGAKETTDFHKMGLAATPANYWKYLEERGRSFAVPISEERAVRMYLPRITLRVDPDGFSWLQQIYQSPDLVSTGLHEKLKRAAVSEVYGYCPDIVNRYIWIDVRGKLYLSEVQVRVRNEDDYKYISIYESKLLAAARKELTSRTRNVNNAERVKTPLDYQKATGEEFNRVLRKGGVVKKGKGTSSAEAAHLNKKPRERS